MNILYHDTDIAVCIKPVGLDSEHDMPAAIREQLSGEVFPIHRLDRAVGGVMVFARTKKSAAALSKAVQEGTMVKEYLALVHGTPPADGDWEDLLFKDSRKNKVFVVNRERRGVKKARLTFERQTAGESSRVHIRLYTGRTHQIRVQFASRGYPLVGDRKYGAKDDVSAPMLFSHRLTFPHNGKTVCFEATPDWAQEASV